MKNKSFSTRFGAAALAAGLIFSAACAGGGGGAGGNAPAHEHEHQANAPVNAPAKAVYAASVTSNPATIEAGKPVSLTFAITRDGAPVREFAVVHEKSLHAIIVSRDLAEFYHVHADAPQPDGAFRVDFNFPNGGDYRVFLDFTPTGGERAAVPLDVRVAGKERPAQKPAADAVLTKTVDGLKIVLDAGGAAVAAGVPTTLAYTVTDAATGAVPADLENYLGEPAHFVIVSSDLADFVHAHPAGHDGMMMDGGHDAPAQSATPGRVSTTVTFPRAGIYRVWAQFQRRGKVVTVPFTIEAGAPAAALKPDESQFPADAKRVIVSRRGFEPESVTLDAGGPRKIAFFRADAENCADEVVFKDLAITRKLPVGEVVVVDLAEAKAGEISFACGMNMLRGKVVVR